MKTDLLFLKVHEAGDPDLVVPLENNETDHSQADKQQPEVVQGRKVCLEELVVYLQVLSRDRSENALIAALEIST